MSSTYTSSNGIEKIGIGEQANTWGASLNNDFDLIDQSLDGVAVINLTTSSYTLTVTDGSLSNGRCKVIIFQGSPSGTVTVNVTPVNISKYYWIVNQTAQSIVLSNGAGTQLTVEASTTSPAFCDGIGNIAGFQAGNNTFHGLTVIGDATVFGQVNLNTLAVNGGATMNGDLSVGGNINIGTPAKNLTDFVNALIPSLTSLPGTLVLSAVNVQGVSGGSWVIFTFGSSPGTRVRIAIGSGTIGNNGTIPVPSGFSTTNMVATCSVGQVSASSSNNLDTISVHMSGATVVATASDFGGTHQYTMTANWMAAAWLQSF